MYLFQSVFGFVSYFLLLQRSELLAIAAVAEAARSPLRWGIIYNT
jgi:hypothetical protein